jgi:hypothetical protein
MSWFSGRRSVRVERDISEQVGGGKETQRQQRIDRSARLEKAPKGLASQSRIVTERQNIAAIGVQPV